MLVKDIGYIVRQIKVGDHGKMVVFFSKYKGKYSFYVPNAMSKENISALGIMNECSVVLYNKNTPILKEISIKKSLSDMKGTNNQYLALYLSCVISMSISENYPLESIYSGITKIVNKILSEACNKELSEKIQVYLLRLVLNDLGIMYNQNLRNNSKKLHTLLEQSINKKIWLPKFEDI